MFFFLEAAKRGQCHTVAKVGSKLMAILLFLPPEY